MSDFEKHKYYGKRKGGYQLKESSRDSSSTFGNRFFNSKGGSYSKFDKEATKEIERSDTPTKSIKQPTILLKTREHVEERAVSPKGILRDVSKENEPQPHVTVVPHSAPDSSTDATRPKHMSKSVKLIEDGTLYSDNVQDFLLENSDFLVIGVIGGQGVGKSTLLNLLAHNNVTPQLKESLFKSSRSNGYTLICKSLKELNVNENNNIEDVIFKPQELTNIYKCTSGTYGIDFFITPNRIMLLDCQPFVSGALIEDLIQNESKGLNVVGEFIPEENIGEVEGLQLTTFMMSVCHVLLFVQDHVFDSNLIRFLQTAEILKPTISSPEDDFADHFPHLIVVHNRALTDDFDLTNFKNLQETYRSIFNRTKLHFESRLGIGSGQLIKYLCPQNCGDPLNIFLIPEQDQDSGVVHKGHPTLEKLVDKLRTNILGATKYPLTHVKLSEKTWLIYSARVWDHVKKSTFFIEYAKLMP